MDLVNQKHVGGFDFGIEDRSRGVVAFAFPTLDDALNATVDGLVYRWDGSAWVKMSEEEKEKMAC